MPHEAHMIKAASPRPDTARARLSSVEEDRQGDVLEPSGCRYQAYMQGNPILLFDHGHDATIGRRPIARMLRITASSTDLVGEWKWSASPEGRDIQTRWNDGDLNAVSVGFLALEAVPRRNGGLHVTVWEMVENSVVALPACASCLAVRSACQCHQGSTPMGQGTERFDIDEGLVRQLVRAAVRAQIMALTGRLDAGTPPRRVRPVAAREPVVLELAEETVAERQHRLYREAGQVFARVDNSRLGELRRHQAAQAGR